MLNKGQWILAASFIAVIFGGSFAFWWVEDGWTWLDALYMTIISVTTVGYGEVQPLSSAGRVVAMIVLLAGLGIFGFVISQVTSYAVGGALEGSVQRRRTAASARKLSGHTVICGLGGRGYALAYGNSRCVVIEPNSENPVAAEEKKNKRLVLHGNAQYAEFLKMSGAERAKQIIVVAGKDSDNLEIAGTIREHLGAASPVQVIAAVEAYATRDCFADPLHLKGIDLFGFREQSLLEFAQSLALDFAQEWDRLPEQPLSIVLQVEGPLLEEVIRAFAMVFQLGGLKPLNIVAYGVSQESRSNFEARFPEYERCCLVTWHEAEFTVAADGAMPPDFAFFFANSVTRVTELAQRCIRFIPGMSPSRVYACLEQSGATAKIARELANGGNGPCIVSLYDLLARKDGLVSYAMDDEGCKMHEAYRSTAEHAVSPWEELSEFHRNSNRLAALQQAVYKRVWAVCSVTSDKVELLEFLSQCEHLRWMAFHLMCGYRLDQRQCHRDQWQRLKVHPNLLGYEALSEEDREKDRVNVRAALAGTCNL